MCKFTWESTSFSGRTFEFTLWKCWHRAEATLSPQDEGFLSLELAHLESEVFLEGRNQGWGVGINVGHCPAFLPGPLLILYLSPGYLIHAHNLYHGIEADDSQIRISASTSSPSCNPSICLPACHFPLNVSKASQNMHISQTNSWSFPSKPFLLGFCLGERHCLYLAARCRIAGVALGKILSLTTLIIYSFPSPVDSSF